jgi:hypothetical protein
MAKPTLDFWFEFASTIPTRRQCVFHRSLRPPESPCAAAIPLGPIFGKVDDIAVQSLSG